MRTGLIAGSFDIIHPGYIRLFQDAKRHCDFLIVALHVDPSVERTGKEKPIFSVDERKEILSAIKYIDQVVTYCVESDLTELMKQVHIDVRILGSDYLKTPQKITSPEMSNEVYFHLRNHDWSQTKIKRLLREKK